MVRCRCISCNVVHFCATKTKLGLTDIFSFNFINFFFYFNKNKNIFIYIYTHFIYRPLLSQNFENKISFVALSLYSSRSLRTCLLPISISLKIRVSRFTAPLYQLLLFSFWILHLLLSSFPQLNPSVRIGFADLPLFQFPQHVLEANFPFYFLSCK